MVTIRFCFDNAFKRKQKIQNCFRFLVAALGGHKTFCFDTVFKSKEKFASCFCFSKLHLGDTNLSALTNVFNANKSLKCICFL